MHSFSKLLYYIIGYFIGAVILFFIIVFILYKINRVNNKFDQSDIIISNIINFSNKPPIGIIEPIPIIPKNDIYNQQSPDYEKTQEILSNYTLDTSSFIII